MVRKEPSPETGCVRVTFELPDSLWASRVCLVGDFNNWDPTVTPFQCVRCGVWRVTLELPARRRYEFRYLIDGRWCSDYRADGCTKSRFQTFNSVVDTTLQLESLTTYTGQVMVHEAAFDKGMDFARKQH